MGVKEYMRKKMIYIMNIDWQWIKQRPHFIAEELSRTYDLKVVYQHQYKRFGLQKRKKNSSVNASPVFTIPFIGRFKSLQFINLIIKNNYIKKQISKEKPDYVYVTYPDQFNAIPDDYVGTIIYDCMDNHPAFINDKKIRANTVSYENKLISRANIVLVSSKKLQDTLLNRYGYENEKKIQLIRNGFGGDIQEIEHKNTEKKNSFTITYFGTISDWFDFDVILDSLNQFSDLRYVLIGPVSNITIPDHRRIEYLGTVEHDNLYERTKETDCYIMPFKLNSIVESVDPVKIYEYINFNKDIISIFYEEVRHFEPYVHFYSDSASFIEKISEIMEKSGLKYSESDRLNFLKQNSWQNRVESIIKLME